MAEKVIINGEGDYKVFIYWWEMRFGESLEMYRKNEKFY
mgnify:CR=1 FL=1